MIFSKHILSYDRRGVIVSSVANQAGDVAATVIFA